MVTGTKGGQPIADATFTIDPTKTPKHLDLTFDRIGLSPGIYKIEGDTLTLCRGSSRGKAGGDGRPKEFKNGNRALLREWKRVKPAQ